MNFEEALSMFVSEMKEKFAARHNKQHHLGRKSVIDEGFTEADLDYEHVKRHFIDEILEWLNETNRTIKAREDVDIANMAFLDWWAAKQ